MNGQVEVVKKSLKTILQRMINSNKLAWHLMLYLALRVYRSSVKTTTNFCSFQHIYGLEEFLSIELQIPSLKLAVGLLPKTTPLEECLLYLEQRQDISLANEAHKKHVKCQYDRSIHPRVFSEGDLFLVYDQDKYPLGEGKFKPMCFKLFIIKKVLEKGAYQVLYFKGNCLVEPRNGLYLKKYYT
jgi:hypothetical protein